MNVKICGITNLDDALAAIDAGADLIGFNFYPKSPRYISPAACVKIQPEIRSRQPAIVTVGIFVNSPADFVADILDCCSLDLAQLHGDEPPEMLAWLWGRAYKAIRPRSVEEAAADARRYTPLAHGQPALLIDASYPSFYGGSGRVAEWPVAQRLASDYAVLLAGGLTPENVASAVRIVNPWGVDVASGVESSPGKKDRRKMVDFVHAARSAVMQLA